MIWLIGNKGMLGSDAEVAFRREGLDFLSSDREVDITDPAALSRFGEGKYISWIVNCSAYTAVDRAEDEADAAFRINAEGPLNLARLAASLRARLVHISTDYVFDGGKEGAYTEEDRPNPIGIYGESKLRGEVNITGTMDNFFIIRTAWLYGRYGNNFVRTMLRLFRERDEARVVADQWGSPTYAADLAGVIAEIITGRSEKFGIYHYTNEGKTNWYEFACGIDALALKYGLTERSARVVPITTKEYPTRAARPMNSLLSKEKIRNVMGIVPRRWEEALEEYIKDCGPLVEAGV